MTDRNDKIHPINVTKDFKDELYRIAQKRGISISGLVRSTLHREIEKERQKEMNLSQN